MFFLICFGILYVVLIVLYIFSQVLNWHEIFERIRGYYKSNEQSPIYKSGFDYLESHSPPGHEGASIEQVILGTANSDSIIGQIQNDFRTATSGFNLTTIGSKLNARSRYQTRLQGSMIEAFANSIDNGILNDIDYSKNLS
jgi:hypothetical protein